MSFEPSEVMVEAAAGYIHAQTDATKETAIRVARAALRAAFAAAVEEGEAEPIAEVADLDGKMLIGPLFTLAHNDSPVDGLFLRSKPQQEGEK